MGYELHITRQDDCWENDAAKQIAEAEWQQVIENDDEMQLRDFAEAHSSTGEIVRIESPLLAAWQHPINNETVWFRYHNGQIIVKSPDDIILQKTLEIAKLLNARVQGDDGEWYDNSTVF